MKRSANDDQSESSARRSLRAKKSKPAVEYTDEDLGLEPKRKSSRRSSGGAATVAGKKKVKEETVVAVGNREDIEVKEGDDVAVPEEDLSSIEMINMDEDYENAALDEQPDGPVVAGLKVEMNPLEAKTSPVKARAKKTKVEGEEEDTPPSVFIGDAVPEDEAKRRWPDRYQGKGNQAPGAEGEKLQARQHFRQALIDGEYTINLYDDAFVQGEEGKGNYICKIIEMFEATDNNFYFTAQWFYRANDTVIKDHGHLIDGKRVFFSEIRNDNPLDCIVKKLNIVKVALNADVEVERAMIPECDYYYDMLYILPFSTFLKAPEDTSGSESSSAISSVVNVDDKASTSKPDSEDTSQAQICQRPQMRLLDLYAGCGGMSTGLCIGANLSGINLETRWAVDLNPYACESLKVNHPETEVRNEAAEDFLSLLKEWKKLCIMFGLIRGDTNDQYFDPIDAEDESEEEDNSNTQNGGKIFEVEKILEIRYVDPSKKDFSGLQFKVCWKGYGPAHDSWEPLDGLRNCRKVVKEFVTKGYNSKYLPLPGEADIICGGPPCQGVSGFNRFRNTANPLEDTKNSQLLVYMNIVDFLKPKFVLMENVVDLLKFSNGFLGRYGLGRLIQMNYQTRIGMMAAGSYGLPQYRMRVFMWGALPTETLPQYPLPTHEVIVRGGVPLEFEENVVRWNTDNVNLGRKLLLEDAISELPAITNDEQKDEMPYGQEPISDFQRYIRLGRDEMLNATSETMPTRKTVFDHRSLELNADDYERVCQIPMFKGANFRHLPGVRVNSENKVEWDPDVPRVLLRSGKQLIPDYAMSFTNGTSSKPFARLWWDETVPTVVTRAEPHNQQVIHPTQNRVLSIRENARLQGFPDYYKLCGPVKERYIQVGNAVAVPVARALGYALGLAIKRETADGPLCVLPPNFPFIAEPVVAASSEDEVA